MLLSYSQANCDIMLDHSQGAELNALAKIIAKNMNKSWTILPYFSVLEIDKTIWV